MELITPIVGNAAAVNMLGIMSLSAPRPRRSVSDPISLQPRLVGNNEEEEVRKCSKKNEKKFY